MNSFECFLPGGQLIFDWGVWTAVQDTRIYSWKSTRDSKHCFLLYNMPRRYIRKKNFILIITHFKKLTLSTPAAPGVATGVIINTGDRTIIGRIASLASGVGNEKTPIAIEIEHFVDIIAGLAIFFGFTFFVVAMFIGYAFLEAMIDLFHGYCGGLRARGTACYGYCE